ncbi:unnamed protein product (macronuclear) [Paramecium tetraurelia]|uniref:APCDD1 domain-containing protein n=1 Tax=Paramecium tetraurelia TaxID=5888 RepID=A0DMH4_PARTE|nr:uncharacterized protein GSPATT00018459001 [Paramecium tetraurelia]CAK84241.1 unnamed protein product [Paramecium tetraurelia]|eukprot:XP_001451638.1 hypothetical protein (macronuclear) [Paramecium tetraurelia strain d4-2]
MFRITYLTKTLLTITIFLNIVISQTLDDIKSQIVNDWQSIALELVPNSQGDQVYPEYKRRQWNFTSDSEFTALIETFTDKSGSNKKLTFSGQGEITYQGASDVISGAFLTKITFSKQALVTLHTDDLVTAFNGAQQGQDGVTWVKDKPQDITTVAVPAMSKQSNSPFLSYDLVYIRDDYLYMGEVDVFGTHASADNPPKGLSAPLIPNPDPETPLTLDELKQSILGGQWTSLTKEVRPGLSNQGKLMTTFQTRTLTFLSELEFSLVLTSYSGYGQSSALMAMEVVGPYEWEEDASQVVPGAQFAKFSMTQMYITPMSDEVTANLNQGLPQGMDPFKTNQKVNMTGKDFPALGMSSGSSMYENDMVYQRQNRLFLEARPVDGGMLQPKERRTYSLQRDLIDTSRSSFNGFLILNLIMVILMI